MHFHLPRWTNLSQFLKDLHKHTFLLLNSRYTFINWPVLTDWWVGNNTWIYFFFKPFKANLNNLSSFLLLLSNFLKYHYSCTFPLRLLLAFLSNNTKLIFSSVVQPPTGFWIAAVKLNSLVNSVTLLVSKTNPEQQRLGNNLQKLSWPCKLRKASL